MRPTYSEWSLYKVFLNTTVHDVKNVLGNGHAAAAWALKILYVFEAFEKGGEGNGEDLVHCATIYALVGGLRLSPLHVLYVMMEVDGDEDDS